MNDVEFPAIDSEFFGKVSFRELLICSYYDLSVSSRVADMIMFSDVIDTSLIHFAVHLPVPGVLVAWSRYLVAKVDICLDILFKPVQRIIIP